MSPPTQEGDQAMSNQNGSNPSSRIPENSVELIILSEKYSSNRRNLIRKLLIEGYSAPNQKSTQSLFTRFQNGLLSALSESKYLMVRKEKDKQFLAIREDFLTRLVDAFTYELLLSEFNPMFSEVNTHLLLLVEDRLRDIKNRKSVNELDFEYKESKKLEDFVRFAFSNNVEPQMSIIANLVLDILNQRAWQNGNRTTFIKDLTIAVNHLNPEVKKRFDNWRKASVQIY